MKRLIWLGVMLVGLPTWAQLPPLSPTITTPSPMPAGAVNQSYSTPLAAVGGTPPYVFSCCVAGTLPPGLHVGTVPPSGNYAVLGTPTTANTYTFTIQVADSSVPPKTATKQFQLTVNPVTIAITTPPQLVTGYAASAPFVGLPYYEYLTATGGVAPYRWSLINLTTLPPGLALIDAAIYGTPTQATQFGFTIQVQDSSSPPLTTSQNFSLLVSPSSVLQPFYRQSFSATLPLPGSDTPYTWTLGSGALPPGMALNSGGTITGVATNVGTYPVVLVATGNSGGLTNVPISVNPIIGLDAYGGLLAMPAGSGNYVGYTKLNGHQIFTSPLNNAFFLLSIQAASPGYMPTTLYQQRYGVDNGSYYLHSDYRAQSSYFNTWGEFAISNFASGSGANPISMPFVPLVRPASYAELFYTQCGNPHPIKNLFSCTGTGSLCSTSNPMYANAVWAQIFATYHAWMMDVFDPMYTSCSQAAVAATNAQTPNGIFTNRYVPWITLDESDEYWTLKGGSKGAAGGYFNIAYTIAVMNFTCLVPCNNNEPGSNFDQGGIGTSTNVFSKFAWITYLQGVYGSGPAGVTALNVSWGTSGFYTAWGDAGGWGGGTGVIDEDGRHAWTGTDLYLTGASAGFAADVNGFLQQYAYQTEAPAIAAIRVSDPNHLIAGMNFLGGGNCDDKPRNAVIDGFYEAGVQIFITCAAATSSLGPAGMATFLYNRLITADAPRPVYVWLSISANANSYWFNQCDAFGNYQPNGGFVCPSNQDDFATQQIRAQQYNTAAQALYAAKASNGDYPIAGIAWWGQTDQDTGQHTNFGQTTILDDAYDGLCSTPALTIDPWMFPCGGEAGSFGNFTGPEGATNLGILETIINGGVPSSAVQNKISGTSLLTGKSVVN